MINVIITQNKLNYILGINKLNSRNGMYIFINKI